MIWIKKGTVRIARSGIFCTKIQMVLTYSLMCFKIQQQGNIEKYYHSSSFHVNIGYPILLFLMQMSSINRKNETVKPALLGRVCLEGYCYGIQVSVGDRALILGLAGIAAG
jgi:hypothetical protein